MRLMPITYETLASAAARLSVQPRTLRGYIARGVLPGYRIGGKDGKLIRVDSADIDALVRPIRAA